MTTEAPVTTVVEPGPAISRQELFALLRRRRRLFWGVLLGVWGAVILFTFTSDPVYEGQCAVIVNTNGPSLSQLGSVLNSMPMLGGGTPGLNDQQWMLSNPPLIQEAANQLGIKAPINKLVKRVMVETVGDTVALVHARDKDAGRAADFANRIAQVHIRECDERAKKDVDKSLVFINQQLDQMRKQLFQSEESLRDYKTGHNIVDATAEAQKAVNVIGDLASQAAASGADASGAAHTADYYRRQLNEESKTYVASSTIARNPLVQDIETRLSGLEAQRAGLASVHGSEAPDLKQVEHQIEATRSELAEAVRTVVSGQVEATNPIYSNAETNLATAEAADRAARARQAALEAVVQAEMRRISIMPNVQTDLVRLQRNSDVASAVYIDLMKSYEQTKLKQLQSLAAVEVLSPATRPEKPVQPRPVLYTALGLLTALLLAIMAVAVAERVAEPLRSERHARAVLEVPPLAAVPAVRKGQGPVLLTEASEDARSPVAEAFRNLRTNLRFSTPEGMPRVLLIASPAREDGRTTVAANLGVALAQGGQRTVLVDGDLRRSRLHEVFAVANEHGLSDVLVGAAGAEECVQPTEVPGLFVLPAGVSPPSPAELLDTDRAAQALAVLRERYDAVIVDSPAWPAADVMLLAERSDGVVLVLRAGATPRRAAEDAVELLAAAGKRPVGLVTNGC